MIDRWVEEIKQTTNPEELGMILVHNGIVRGTSKSGKPVHGMKLSFDEKKLKSVIPIFKQRKGIAEVRVWINAGNLRSYPLEKNEEIGYPEGSGIFRQIAAPLC